MVRRRSGSVRDPGRGRVMRSLGAGPRFVRLDHLAGPGVVARAAGCGGLRTITTSTISGAIRPPMIRSIELVLTESLLRIVWTWVAEDGRPSWSTPDALTIHWWSVVRVQRPSPWPPSESKTHDLICSV